MTISDKIKLLIEELRMKPNSFAQEIGLSATAVYNMIGERQSKPGYDFFNSVKKRWPQVDLNPLFEDGPITSFAVNTTQLAQYGHPGKIPVISQKAAANSLRGIQNNEHIEIDSFIELPKEIIGSGTLVAVQVRGVSMSPVILDGSFVVVRLMDRSEWKNFRNGWIYLIYTEDYGAQIKYLKRSERNSNFIILESENPQEEIITLDASEILGLWEWRANLNLKFQSLKKSFYDRLDKLEAAYFEIQTQINRDKIPH